MRITHGDPPQIWRAGTPGKHAKSAEVQERKEVAPRSGAKERAERALQEAGGQAKESGVRQVRGWALQKAGGQAEVALGITSNDRIYGE